MESCYAAYGMALSCTFELPGMVTTDAQELPHLAVSLVNPAELSKLWSGSDGAAQWRGRLGDGSELVLARGREEDILLMDGERARYRLDPSMRSLAVAPLRPGMGWRRVLLTKVLSIVSVVRGYEALHASAVDSPWGAVVIAAPTGMGKTTLALELTQRGWPLLTDDVLALASAREGVLAYPGTPHANIAAEGPSGGSNPEAIASTLAILGDERWVAVHDCAREPRPVHAICLLERGVGVSLDVQMLASNPLFLAPYMLGLPSDLRRERSRFDLYADLMSSVALVRLTCGVDVTPVRLADVIEQVCADRSFAPAVGSVR